MKAFNSNLNRIVDIEKLEDLTESIVLITEMQETEITNTLNNNGYVSIRDGVLFISGPKPKDSVYNYENNSWIFDQNLYEERIAQDRLDAWERIKEERSKSQVSGVYVDRVDKWFHTDPEAQRNYLFLKVVIDYPEFKPPYWKTMDGSYIVMTPELYKLVVLKMFEKAQFDFKNAEYLYNKMLKVSEPSEFDCTAGWSASFYNSHQ